MILVAEYLLRSVGHHMRRAGVRVSNGLIDAVGTVEELRAVYPADEVKDYGPAVIMPGFVNAHSHLDHAMMDGVIVDAPYATWKAVLEDKSKRLTQQDYNDSALIGALYCIRGGITTVSDVTRNGASLRAAAATGLHGLFVRQVTAAEKREVPLAMEMADNDIRRWRSKTAGNGITIGIGPGTLYQTHPEVLGAIGEYAMDGTPVVIHLAGSREECDFIRFGQAPLKSVRSSTMTSRTEPPAAFLPMGVSPVRYALNWGILYAPNVMAIHCIHVDSEDIQRLAENNVSVVVCPRSNAKLGCGVAPVMKLWDGGLTVGIGTNTPASAGMFDMFEEMRTQLLLERGLMGERYEMGDDTFLSAKHMMLMSTIDSARAIGMQSEVGSLEVGKRADIVVLDVSDSNQMPTTSPNAMVVHDCGRSDVVATMIDGEFVYTAYDGYLCDVDIDRLLARASEIRAKLRG